MVILVCFYCDFNGGSMVFFNGVLVVDFVVMF